MKGHNPLLSFLPKHQITNTAVQSLYIFLLFSHKVTGAQHYFQTKWNQSTHKDIQAYRPNKTEMNTHTNRRKPICTNTNMYPDNARLQSKHKHTHTHTQAYINTHTHTYIDTHTHRQTDRQTHTPTHTHILTEQTMTLLLLLHSPAISLGFTILGEIFAYVTVFDKQ